MRELLEGALFPGLLVQLLLRQAAHGTLCVSHSLLAPCRLALSCAPREDRCGERLALSPAQTKNLRAFSGAALNSWLAHVEELSRCHAAPLFGAGKFTGFRRSPAGIGIGSGLRWSAAAQLQHGSEALLPPRPPVFLPLRVPVWGHLTWVQWCCVNEVRRHETLARDSSADGTMGEHDPSAMWGGCLTTDGLVVCRTLTLPLLQRVPGFPEAPPGKVHPERVFPEPPALRDRSDDWLVERHAMQVLRCRVLRKALTCLTGHGGYLDGRTGPRVAGDPLQGRVPLPEDAVLREVAERARAPPPPLLTALLAHSAAVRTCCLHARSERWPGST